MAVAQRIGRYLLCSEIGSGGMASVHVGRLQDDSVGFSRTVAIKRLHRDHAKDPEFVAMFLDEARLAARIQHPNVVPTLDVVSTEGELFLVMEYVAGASLSRLLAVVRSRAQAAPPRVVSAIVANVLRGLHAAHEARDERGERLDIVHRDVSPHNILVGVDGVARLFDFGVAKAIGRLQTTQDGRVKGKLSYMSHEQLHGTVSRRTDVYAAAVVLWEALVGRRLFLGENEGDTLTKVLAAPVDPPSAARSDLGDAFDGVTMRGLDRNADKRFATALEMAEALESATPGGVAGAREVAGWVEALVADELRDRALLISEVETSASTKPLELNAAMKNIADVSSISVARAPEPSRHTNRWLLIAAISAVAMLAVGIRVRDRPVSPSPSVTREAVTAILPAVAIPSAAATVSATATVTEPAATRTSHVTHAVRSDERPANSASIASHCNPNFTYVDGIKTYKPECFAKP